MSKKRESHETAGRWRVRARAAFPPTLPLPRPRKWDRNAWMPEDSPEDLLKAALEVSGTAAAIPMRYFRGDVAVEDKADETPVTIADRETEEHIRRAIAERFPLHGIYGEEFGRENVDREHTWIIDPIDGTRS